MTGVLTAQGLSNLISSGKANFLNVAVGTSSQAPATTLEALVAELDRNAVGSSVVSGNMIALGAIFGNNEAVGTLQELGCFDSATGLLLYEKLDVPFPKSTAAPLVCRIVISIANKAA